MNNPTMQTQIAAALMQTLPYGLIEYSMIWSPQVTPARRLIYRLQAREHRTDGNASSGWRSPDSNERGGAYQDTAKVLSRIEAGHQINLEDQAKLTGWSTPQAHDTTGRSEHQKEKHGTKHGYKCLVRDAQLSGWPMPRSE